MKRTICGLATGLFLGFGGGLFAQDDLMDFFDERS